MSEFFDRYENRPPKSRELALFRELKGIVSVARARAPALRKQMIGVDIKDIKKRADLARIPVLRRRDLMDLQSEQPPLGGFAATRVGALKRVHVSAGPFFQPEGQGRDWWGAARALFAAGARKGDVALNCLPYHLRPEGHMMDSGAQALGCAVIPAGDAHIGETLEAIRQVQPQFVCGHADFLDQLLFNARRMKVPVDSLKRALVLGDSLSDERRRHFAQNGIAVRLAYVVPEAGVVAYETEAPSGVVAEGMIVNEGLILEVVAPMDGAPLGPGKVGEIVITRLNADYPVLRFGTGDLSEILTSPSPCGRTNLRIRGVMGKVAKPKSGPETPPRK